MDNSGEFLAGLLRPGNASANTAADHITVLDQALAQIPDGHRHGVPVLVRTDGAGCSTAFLAHIRGLREQAVLTGFSVGWAVGDRERHAIEKLPEPAWADAIDAGGRPRDGAHVAELTGLLPAGTLAEYPPGTRILLRRERPHPGAQLDAFEERDGWRYQCLVRWLEQRKLAAPVEFEAPWHDVGTAIDGLLARRISGKAVLHVRKPDR